MKLEIRKLTNKDKDALIGFEKLVRETEPDIWCEPFDEKTYSEKLDKVDLESTNNTILCLFHDAKIIGRCDIIVYESMVDFVKVGYVDWIYVEKNYRNRKQGERLIEGAVAYFEELGIESYYLFTAENKEAKAFYSKLKCMELVNKEVAQNKF